MIANNQIKPGNVDAVQKGMEKNFVSILKEASGFRAVYMSIGSKGEYTGYVLWDSRANAEVYAASQIREKAFEAVADLFEGPMKTEFREVFHVVTA